MKEDEMIFEKGGNLNSYKDLLLVLSKLNASLMNNSSLISFYTLWLN